MKEKQCTVPNDAYCIGTQVFLKNAYSRINTPEQYKSVS